MKRAFWRNHCHTQRRPRCAGDSRLCLCGLASIACFDLLAGKGLICVYMCVKDWEITFDFGFGVWSCCPVWITCECCTNSMLTMATMAKRCVCIIREICTCMRQLLS